MPKLCFFITCRDFSDENKPAEGDFRREREKKNMNLKETGF